MRDQRFFFKTHYGASRALVIGIDTYQQVGPLSYAVSDAVAVRDLLIEQFGFPEANVSFLSNEAATRRGILESFERLTNDDVGFDDRIVVFFAGHGHTRSGVRGEVGYLVPHDADVRNFSTFIRWDELTRNADFIRAKHILFIMDACYGGLALVRSANPGSTRFLKDMMLRTARQVLTAGKANEVVADSGGPIPNHSVFTGHLIEALEGKARTSDGVLTASGVMAYVYSKVANDKNSNQTPHYGHIDGDGDMVLLAPSLGALEESEVKDIDRLVSVPYFDDEQDISRSTTKVRRVKELLATEAGSIELHDLLASEVRRFLTLTSGDSFAATGQFSVDEFVARLKQYEESSADLSLLLACVAHWGKGAHLATLQKCIGRSSDRLEVTGGSSVWIALRWYPLLLELYNTGIAAVDGRRFDSLAAIFGASVPSLGYPRTETFLEACSDAVLELNRTNVLKQIPGHEKNYTPLSEYLFKILQPSLDDALFLGKNFESAFDVFEIHFALSTVDARLTRGEGAWAPVGRFGWKQARGGDNAPFQLLFKEAEISKRDWAPIRAGMYGGDYERFSVAARHFSEDLSRLRWY